MTLPGRDAAPPPALARALAHVWIVLVFVVAVLASSRAGSAIYPEAQYLLVPAGLALAPMILWIARSGPNDQPAYWQVKPRTAALCLLLLAIVTIVIGVA
jgi:hypothetical protein